LKIIKPISTAITAYILISLGFYFCQTLFFFHPKTLPANYKFNPGVTYTEFNITLQGKAVINGVHMLNSSNAKGVVIYYHGNQNNMEHYFKYNQYFAANNYNCIMVDYPGFGKSTGTITQASFKQIALQTYDYAQSLYAGKKIVVYGKSLGTGIAAYAASQRPCNLLFLETPYFSLSSLAQQYAIGFNEKWLTRYQLNSYQFVQQTKAPVAAITTNTDEVIPYRNSVKLLNYFKPTDKFITVIGARHNTIPQHNVYKKTVDSLLSSL
jgi:uncharacterized protein